MRLSEAEHRGDVQLWLLPFVQLQQVAAALDKDVNSLLWPLDNSKQMKKTINKQTQTRKRCRTSRGCQVSVAVVSDNVQRPTCDTHEDTERRASAARRVLKAMERGKTCSTMHYLRCTLRDWTYQAFQTVFRGWEVCVAPRDLCGHQTASATDFAVAIQTQTPYRECRKAVLGEDLANWLDFSQFQGKGKRRQTVRGRGGVLVINKRGLRCAQPGAVQDRPVVKVVTSLYCQFSFLPTRVPGEKYQLQMYVSSAVINEHGKLVTSSFSAEKESVVAARVLADQEKCVEYLKTMFSTGKDE